MAVLTPLASWKTQNDRVAEEASCLVTYNSSNCVCDTKQISDTIPFNGLPNHTLISIGRNLSQVAWILTPRDDNKKATIPHGSPQYLT